MSDDWTVERHLKDKPAEVVALYERFYRARDALWPVHIPCCDDLNVPA